MTRPSSVTSFLLIALVGFAVAFISPAVPRQEIASEQAVRTAPTFGATKANVAFVDAGLDNPSVENDDAIEAARKCGFCMG